jgi:hypothetical protein
MTSRMTTIASLAAALMIGAASVAPAAAHGGDEGPQGYYGMGPGMMGPGYGMGPGMMGPGYGMGPGMMGQGYGQGPGQQGWRMGPGMMGPGYGMGPGMMGQGYGQGPGQQGWRMGPGMMGPGYGMGPGMMGPGYGMGPGQQPWASPRVAPRMDLSTDDVRSYFQDQLANEGNKRLKVGKVEALDDNTIEAQIETVDGSLVASYKVDRHTGAITPAG